MKNIIVLLVLLYFRRKKKITYMFWMRNFNENYFFSCRFERVSTWFGSLVMEV